MKNENGTLGYGYYSSSSMLGIVCMGVMECVCKGFSQNARANWVVQLNLQGCLVLCSKMVFLCLGRYWRWLARVLGQVWCLECVQQVCLGLSLQEWELVFNMQSFFQCKQELSSFNIGYHRPLKHAAQITLDQWNWFLTLCPKDLLWYFLDLCLT